MSRRASVASDVVGSPLSSADGSWSISSVQVSQVADCISCSCLINANRTGATTAQAGGNGCCSEVDQEQVQSQMRGQRPPEGM